MGAVLASLTVAAAVTTLALFLPAAWDTLTRRYLDDLSVGLRNLGINDADLPRYMRWWGLSLVAVGVVLAVVVGSIALAIIVGYLIYLAPRLLLARRLREQRTLLRDQLVTGCQMLANATRAGLSFADGLAQLADEIPAPLGREIRRVVSEYGAGLPLATALRNAQERIQLESFTIFTCALLVTLEQGGVITDALERISVSLQENQRLERKLEADTAMGRHAVTVLAIFPVVFLGGTALMDPEGVGGLFTSVFGQVVLLVVFVMILAAVRWAVQIYGRLQSA